MSVSKKNLNKLLLIWSLGIRASGHKSEEVIGLCFDPGQ